MTARLDWFSADSHDLGYQSVIAVRDVPETGELAGTIRLQDAPQGTRTFTGDLWMPPDEDFAVIPRPFSADIAIIDPVTLTLGRTVPAGRQPLVAAVLDDGRIIARDWKAGDLLRADLG